MEQSEAWQTGYAKASPWDRYLDMDLLKRDEEKEEKIELVTPHPQS